LTVDFSTMIFDG